MSNFLSALAKVRWRRGLEIWFIQMIARTCVHVCICSCMCAICICMRT